MTPFTSMSTCPCLRVIAAVYTRRSCLSSAGLRKKVGVPKGKNTYVPPCAFHSVCSHPVRTPVVSLAQEIDGSIYSVFTWAGGSTPMDDVINTQWTDTGLEENEKELTLPANYEHVNYSQKFVDQLTKAADFQQKWWGCRHLSCSKTIVLARKAPFTRLRSPPMPFLPEMP